jgi:hypothetical protein
MSTRIVLEYGMTENCFHTKLWFSYTTSNNNTEESHGEVRLRCGIRHRESYQWVRQRSPASWEDTSVFTALHRTEIRKCDNAKESKKYWYCTVPCRSKQGKNCHNTRGTNTGPRSSSDKGECDSPPSNPVFSPCNRAPMAVAPHGPASPLLLCLTEFASQQ